MGWVDAGTQAVVSQPHQCTDPVIEFSEGEGSQSINLLVPGGKLVGGGTQDEA